MLKRTITGVCMGVYAIAMLLLGRTALLINLLVMMLIGVYEVVYVLKKAGYKPVAWIHYLTVASYIPVYLWKQEAGLMLVLFASVVVCMGWAALTRDPSSTDLLATLLPSFYPAYPLLAFAMLTLSPSAHWRLLLWLMLIPSVTCDICALFTGKALGKTKLLPKVSPNKTVEGAIGGFVGAVLSALCIYFVSHARGDGISWTHFLTLGVIGGVVTQIGDIVASYIKRFCGVKDYGTLFPGHGGLLDRIDGILFNAVACCIYTMVAPL